MINNEGVRCQTQTSCPECSSAGETIYPNLRDSLFDAKGNWNLKTCSACNLLWIDPRPISDDILLLYSDYHTHAGKSRSLVKDFVFRSIASAELKEITNLHTALLIFCGKLLGLLRPLREHVRLSLSTVFHRPTGPLLDVGCGTGRYIERMRSFGWDVWGVEPDPKAAAIAREKIGSQVICGYLKDIDLTPNYYAVITLNHVIEHAEAPSDLIQECFYLLRPGGQLIIFTPNAMSYGHNFFTKYWRGLEVPRHLQIYSPLGLSALLIDCGFSISECATTSRSASAIAIGSARIGLKSGNSSFASKFYSSKFGQIIFHAIAYWKWKNNKHCGEEVYISARKNWHVNPLQDK